MNQFELSPETRDVLDRIRHSSKFLSIFEMPSDLAEAAVWEIGKIVLADRGLPLVQHNGYRWYLRELSKLLRTKTEWDLALEMEICLRKWAAYSLDSELLQTLLRECYDRIGAMTPDQIEESPKLETRMTNQGGKPEARMPKPESTTKAPRHQGVAGDGTAKDAKTAKSELDLTTKAPRHQEGSGETRSQRSETRMQKCGGGRDLTTKAPRHEEGSEAGTGTLEPLNPGALQEVASDE